MHMRIPYRPRTYIDTDTALVALVLSSDRHRSIHSKRGWITVSLIRNSVDRLRVDHLLFFADGASPTGTSTTSIFRFTPDGDVGGGAVVAG